MSYPKGYFHQNESLCLKCRYASDCQHAKSINEANSIRDGGEQFHVNSCDHFREKKRGPCRDCHEVYELNNGLCMYCELEERRMETKAIMLAVLAIVVGLSVKFLVG
ncbi:MAG: hypothetical protein ACRC4K_14600 [Plesiomonas shigelloides]